MINDVALLLSPRWNGHTIVIKVCEHFLPYLHTSVPNTTPESMALHDASINICVIKNYAVVCNTTIMTLGEWLAQHESEIRSVAFAVKIAHTCILVATVIFC